jgi:hypothetical protein
MWDVTASNLVERYSFFKETVSFAEQKESPMLNMEAVVASEMLL